eukprot:121459-Prymnesium_polylepis.1
MQPLEEDKELAQPIKDEGERAAAPTVALSMRTALQCRGLTFDGRLLAAAKPPPDVEELPSPKDADPTDAKR